MNINGRSLLSSIVVVGALFAAVASTDDNDAERVEDGSGDNSASGSGDNDAAGSEQPEEFHVGDLVELGDWQVRVHEVTDPFEATDEFLAPDDGNRWVAVDVEVMNMSDEPETVSSMVCFELMDGQNRAYSMTFTGESVTTPDGEVAPDGSRRGTLVYEVPERVRHLRLNFKCDLLSSGTATISL